MGWIPELFSRFPGNEEDAQKLIAYCFDTVLAKPIQMVDQHILDTASRLCTSEKKEDVQQRTYIDFVFWLTLW